MWYKQARICHESPATLTGSNLKSISRSADTDINNSISMLSDNTSYIPEQYFNILKGCRENNTKIIGKNLRSLIKNNGHVYVRSNGLQRLYSFCLNRLTVDRTAEIEIIFERLVKGMKSAVLRYASFTVKKSAADIKIKHTSAKKVMLQTSDPEIADRLRAINGIIPENFDSQIGHGTNWTGSVLKKRLPAVIENLKTPQYMEYLSAQERNQISIDF